MGNTVLKKLPPCPPLPRCHHCLHSLDLTLSMAPMLMRTHPDPNHTSSLPPLRPGEPSHRWRHAMSRPMTTQDMPHSSGHTPAPLTCPAQMCCRHPTRIPHALRVRQPQPRPHARTAAPFDASQHVSTRPAPPCPFLMRRHHPRCVPRALHVPLISCSFS